MTRWKDETRARKSTKKPSSAALFGPSLAAFGGFVKIFFFSAFSFVSKKNLQSLPFGRRLHTVISDGHARRRLSEKKTSLFYIIHTQILSRVVLNTQKKST